MFKTRLLASAALAALLITPAARAGTLYVFGDSLSDDGNFFKLTGQPAAPYYQGRFSNGPVWVEYLHGEAGLNFNSSTDFAYGGAYTGDLTINGTNYGTNIGVPAAPGVSTEITSFAAAGGRFGSKDVVTLWAGANNYFLYAQVVQANPGAATALVTQGVNTTLTQLTQDTASLISLGAKTLIVPNLPDLGSTPTFNGSAQGTFLGNAFSSAHNTALPLELAILHQQTGANILVLNEQKLLENVIASPSTYGFSNVTNACVFTISCVTASTATQNTYLFWDNVHPTTHGHAIIAAYAAVSLLGFESLTVPAQLGNAGAQDFAGLLNTRLDALRYGASGFTYNVAGQAGQVAAPSDNISIFISGGGGFGSRNTRGTDLGYNYNNATTAIGIDDRFNSAFTGGLALGYGDNHASVKGGGTVQDNAFNAGLYALLAQDDYYVKVAGGYAADNYSTKRSGPFSGTISGKTKGSSYSASAEAGYVFHPTALLNIGPEAGLAYTNTILQGYTETGDSLLTQQVNSQGYQQLIGTVAANGSTSINLYGVQLAPYAMAGVQFLLSGNNSSFSSSFTDVPGVSLTSVYPKESTAWAVYSVGTTARLTRQLSASAEVAGTAFKSVGSDVQVSGALHYVF